MQDYYLPKTKFSVFEGLLLYKEKQPGQIFAYLVRLPASTLPGAYARQQVLQDPSPIPPAWRIQA